MMTSRDALGMLLTDPPQDTEQFLIRSPKGSRLFHLIAVSDRRVVMRKNGESIGCIEEIPSGGSSRKPTEIAYEHLPGAMPISVSIPAAGELACAWMHGMLPHRPSTLEPDAIVVWIHTSRYMVLPNPAWHPQRCRIEEIPLPKA
jgi:hypothetical protein